MTSTTASPIEIYRLMQEALLREEATLLPAELLAEDVVVETPFSPPGMRRHEGREAWLEFYRSRPLPFRFSEFRELSIRETDDPEVLVVEYELVGTVTTTGVTASATFIAVLRVRDGLIEHWREYQDVLAISRALSLQPEDLGSTATADEAAPEPSAP
ncbi:nuclear transport factor 2 family protein [Glycomyces sp. TRM65418]|uniref:nuclear transport factor 2 family protein n=1 Tax=Glycomyces sp. TRM65418 TaxID=2867006 RepID=UPI001CE6667A|nr:nuclear transport factor 2 family protein [Glycomyces sp. TRM65418]MCC3763350.1 nuclear transport factor 2 family protein [Glycomyces sp. TRM65418]QZD57344.1 nuclear transport factor 2 family protein [Glycomyces sp. TRM65418]